MWFVEAWVTGWIKSRRPPLAEPVDGGWFIQRDTDFESCRWVLTGPDPERLAEIVAGPVPEAACVKFAGDPAVWLPRFGSGWVEADPGWFMTRELGPADAPSVPDGYRIEVSAEPELIMVRVLDGSGELAASGQCGLVLPYAVPDIIVTEEAHRRRGLGRLVMGELQRLAYDSGARTAVLSATTDGRELYRSLGWRELSGLVGAYYRPGS
ncbi:GNAT family N-acetyltransferase [Microlunatus sp. GCM10028923]|uniref:GNAT family N-acetyltransferase n=1 Tax=Microlunatus sp. GCM10028923 TaxID=3273400 RepID=UPI0036138E9D